MEEATSWRPRRKSPIARRSEFEFQNRGAAPSGSELTARRCCGTLATVPDGRLSGRASERVRCCGSPFCTGVTVSATMIAVRQHGTQQWMYQSKEDPLREMTNCDGTLPAGNCGSVCCTYQP